MVDPASPAAYAGSAERLQALIEATLALNESRELKTLLKRILDLATTNVGAERGALFRTDPESGGLVANIFHGDEVEAIHVPAGQGLAGEVAAHGRSIRIADAYADGRFDSSIDKRTGYQTHSLLVVPLRHRNGEIVGVLEVVNKRGGEFDDDDEAFLQAFGAQVAVALETSRLVEERVRAERLAAVGTVAARLVHDLKNPLSGLQGYAQLIEQDPPEDLLARCLAGVRRQADRMQHMVQSILRYVRGEEPFLFAKSDFDDLLDEAVEDLRAASMRDGVEVERSGTRVGFVRIDPMAIRRLLDNLARNATEAMDGKGHLWIDARLEGEAIALEVRDDGRGMSEQVRAHVFESFSSAGKAQGTGLGMAIVKRIVDGHDGTVDVQSAPGEGTCVRIHLPLAGPAEEH